VSFLLVVVLHRGLVRFLRIRRQSAVTNRQFSFESLQEVISNPKALAMIVSSAGLTVAGMRRSCRPRSLSRLRRDTQRGPSYFESWRASSACLQFSMGKVAGI
jgi:hypothetical protein